MPDELKIVALDLMQLNHLIHSLAWMRTLTQSSKVTENFDNPFYVWFVQNQQPSSLSFGENFSHQTFLRWVREDEARLYQMLARTLATRGIEAGWQWLQNARAARTKMLRTYQQAIEQLNATNAQMAWWLRGSMRTVATVQAGAELALGLYGLLGVGAAGVRVAWGLSMTGAGMTLKLAVRKAVAGVAATVAINMAERWDWAQSSDVWVVPLNIPSFISDGLKDFLAKRRQDALSEAQKKLANTKGGTSAGWSARQQLRGDVKTLQKPVQTGTLGMAATGVAWVLAVKGAYDSLAKLHDRWDQ